jgi:hypothetical protein
MLGAPRLDHFETAVVTTQRETDMVDRVTDLDLPEKGWIVRGERGGTIKRDLD